MNDQSFFYRSVLSLTMTTSALILTACQSTPNYQQTSSSQYRQSQQPQILNMTNNPSHSQLAKADLVIAMQQHLASEHMSSSTSRYSIRPFVSSDSIDADSESVFTSLVQLYLDKKDTSDTEDVSEDISPDTDSNLALSNDIKADTLIKKIIDEQTSDQDKADYKKQLIAQYIDAINQDIPSDTLSQSEIYDQATNRANLHIQLGAVPETLNTSEYTDINLSDTDTDDKNNDLNLKGNLNNPLTNVATLPMQMLTKDKDNDADLLLGLMKRTPEQIEAMQQYNMQYLSVNQIGHYQPNAKRHQGVFSYDFASPTQTFSLKLPYGVDFKNGKATIDPSAFFPLVALIKPEALAKILDNQSDTHTIDFSLPAELKDKIPSEVIYTSFVEGTNKAFTELDSEYFTAIDTSDDRFAKQVKAKKAVKVHWGTKVSGEFMGKILKHMSQQLHNYVAQHPDKYSEQEMAKFQQQLSQWSKIEKSFQSKDIGGLFQLVEAIAPVSANQTMYYYLTADNKLIAHQSKISVGSELYGWTMDTAVQTNYDDTSVKKDPLYALYNDSFGENASTPLNGNDLINDIMGKDVADDTDDELYKQARYARDDYPKWYDADIEPASAAMTDIADSVYMNGNPISLEQPTDNLNDSLEEAVPLENLDEAKRAFLLFEQENNKDTQEADKIK